MNKRGQGLSTSAIVLIVLGVLVLVLLIVGFTMGWEKLAPWISSSNNVDTIIQQCSVACSTGSTYDFCFEKRDLKADKQLKDVTCYYLSEEQLKYGIDGCSSISCEVVFVTGAGEELTGKCSDNTGKTVQTLVNNKLESFDCPAAEPAE